jgi:hypothetical protein
MKEVTIVDYTFAWDQFLQAHPEEAIHKNNMMFVFMVNDEPVQTIARCLN